MRRAPAAVLMLALASASAHAGGVNLRWSKCAGDGGVLNRTFSCTTNAGSHVLVASFVPETDVPQVVGQQATIDLIAASSSLPAWWGFRNSGACRSSSLSLNTVPDVTNLVCEDWSQSASVGGITSYTVGLSGPNTARLVTATSVTPGEVQDLVAGHEYFSFNLVINNSKTVGSGSCSGCDVPVCIALTQIQVTSSAPGASVTLTGPANETNSHFAGWQGGASVPPGSLGLCAPLEPTGYTVQADVVGRGQAKKTPLKTRYPAGSALELNAIPEPGEQFVAWSGDTVTAQPRLDIVVTRDLGYTATFVHDPAFAPVLRSVGDVPADNGSFVALQWDRSPLDQLDPPGFLCCYVIERRPSDPPSAPWAFADNAPATAAASYTRAVPTPTDSTQAGPTDYRFRVAVMLAADTSRWVSNDLEGHSVDNLPPPAPGPVDGTIESGFASIYWPPVNVLDLAHYVLYRGLEAIPPMDDAHRIGTTTNAWYNDAPGHYANYRVSAVDVHGNESAGTLLTPSNTAGADGPPVPHALAVGDPVPSPMAQRMTLPIGLPQGMNVVVDVLDAQGRIVRRVAEGSRPAGWTEVSWDGRDARGSGVAAGVYFIRVRTPAGQRLKRLALVH